MKKNINLRSISDFRTSYFEKRKGTRKEWYGWEMMDPQRMISLLDYYRSKEKEEYYINKAFEIIQLIRTNERSSN